MRLAERFTRGFARFVTVVSVRAPWLWRLLRGPLARRFDELAPRWDVIAGTADHLAPLDAALEALPQPPQRVLDLGTGTGAAAFDLARRFPSAEITGVDLAPRMVQEARRKLPRELDGRIVFEAGDAASLRFQDGAFDLVTLVNMIPFFDELTRVLAPDGNVIFSFSAGPETPIYVSQELLERELRRRGFMQFARFSGGRGTSLLARKGRRT